MTKTRNTNPYEVSVADYIHPMHNVVILGLATLVMTVCIIIPLLFAGYADTHYSTVAEVYSVDATETIFIDGTGNLWAVKDTTYKVGEFVEIKFNNNRTDYTRNDDIIVKVTKLDN